MKRMIQGFVVVILFSTSAMGQQALPRFCDTELLSPKLGPTGYQYRPDSRACEGTWERRIHGSRALRIVSLFTSYRPNQRPRLTWHGAIIRPTRIQVQSLRDDIPYQLDSELQPSDSPGFSWNSRVIDQLGLSGSDLGVLAYEENDQIRRVYLPFGAQLPPPIRDEQLRIKGQWLSVTLLPPQGIRKLRLVIRPMSGKIVAEQEITNELPAGLPRTISAKAPPTPGDYVLAISANLSNQGAPVSLEARFRY